MKYLRKFESFQPIQGEEESKGETEINVDEILGELSKETGVEINKDSLEEVGRMIAQCKLDLKQRFPQQKGKDFFTAYAPVSELEAMMKNFESILNQLQNSISRFEEGNNQDFIYFGPHIRQRLEVAANDDLIGQLSIQMNDCRLKKQQYFTGE